MRKALIAANWKMHKTVAEAREFLSAFLSSVRDIADRDIVIAPPFTLLHAMKEQVLGTRVMLSAQNVFYEEKGAYTGEVSPAMLKDIGCDYVIIGHSERRQYFKETDEVVNKKVRASQKNRLAVIFCVGESLQEREAGKTFDVLTTQVLHGLKEVDCGGIAVAYEPVWAIGTGRTATPEQAQEAHQVIRRRLSELFGDAADTMRIIYGGSVTPDTIDTLMACSDVDGALVGGASLKPDSFGRIVSFRRGI